MPSQTATVVAQLRIEGPDNFQIVKTLTPDDNMLIGSSSRCGLNLLSPTMSPIHCLLRLADGQLCVQEWSGSNGTFVDGTRVEGEALVPRDSAILLGGFEIRYELTAANGERIDPADLPAPAPAIPLDSAVEQNLSPERFERDRQPDGFSPALSQTPPALSEPPASEPPAPESEPTSAELEALPWREGQPPVEFAAGSDDRAGDRSQDAWAASPVDDEDEVGSQEWREALHSPLDSFDQETIEMLQQELEHLQSELAVRDAQIAELSAESGPSEVPTPAVAEEETAALASRLEQLLDEVERADERVKVLEDLLQASEEAHQAEQEERHQLESWVSDIEQRIGKREDEWKAEMATLEHRIQVITGERDHVERRLHQAGSPESARAEVNSLLEQLREQNGALQAKLDLAERAHTELENRIEDLQQRGTSEAVEEALRVERAQMAQERANVTRMRAEISAKLADLENSNGGKSQEIEARLRLYRQHLKEIHKEEQEQAPAKADRSLSSRIAKIWKRLEH